MLRINVFKGAGGVIKYYNQTLKSGDYYMSENGINKSQEIIGNWHGNLAEKLGLSGKVTQQDFYKLTNNTNPANGQELTMRTVAGRRVGYDFNFHVPKSFSLVQALHSDNRLTDVFREAVKETMDEMEMSMLTRVRKGKAMDDRKTGSMVWGEFIHFTARPVGGVPDPHLHAHCFVFNATYDDVENTFKAGQFVDIKRNADLSQAQFHARLMAKTRALGYEIKLKPKGWEIDGVPQSAIDRFSRRTFQVEQQAKALGIIDDKGKEKLGATTREKKAKELTMGELKGLWNMQLTSQEKEALEVVKQGADKSYFKNDDIDKNEILKQTVDFSLDDILERESTASLKKITIKALLYGKGYLTSQDIAKELETRQAEKKLLSVDLGKRGIFFTTRKVLVEEKKIVELINSGRGKYAKMQLDQSTINPELYSTEQRQAVEMLFNSTDAVVSIRGGAGTGKTKLLQLASEKIKEAGKLTFTFAPSSQASRGVLRADGFSNADTIAKYLQNKELQASTSGNIIWIDEAGLLSVPELKEVLRTARENKARVVLVGDTRQHSSVERGDALRLAEKKTQLEQTELTTTRRQLVEEYKTAVEEIRDGEAGAGFDRLDNMGSIIENEDPLERFKQIAKEYSNVLEDNKTVLVVSPTHAEGSAITDNIRTQLKNRLILGREEKPFEILQNKNLTEVEKQPEFLQNGDILQFFREYQGIERGQSYEVKVEKNKDGVPTPYLLGQDKSKIPIQKEWSRYYSVYTTRKIPISENEKIRITQNGKDRLGQDMLNGQELTVKGFDYNGRILAEDSEGKPKHLPSEFKNFTYGYVSTSHGSQGKTADVVLIGQSSASFSSSDQKQFYVSVSRGREAIKIFTDNKEELKEAITPTKNRFSALELMEARMAQAREWSKRFPKKEDLKQPEPEKELINPFDKSSQSQDTNQPITAVTPTKTWVDIVQTITPEPPLKNTYKVFETSVAEENKEEVKEPDKTQNVVNTLPLTNSQQPTPINPFAKTESTINNENMGNMWLKMSKSTNVQTMEEYQKKQKTQGIDIEKEI